MFTRLKLLRAFPFVLAFSISSTASFTHDWKSCKQEAVLSFMIFLNALMSVFGLLWSVFFSLKSFLCLMTPFFLSVSYLSFAGEMFWLQLWWCCRKFRTTRWRLLLGLYLSGIPYEKLYLWLLLRLLFTFLWPSLLETILLLAESLHLVRLSLPLHLGPHPIYASASTSTSSIPFAFASSQPLDVYIKYRCRTCWWKYIHKTRSVDWEDKLSVKKYEWSKQRWYVTG